MGAIARQEAATALRAAQTGDLSAARVHRASAENAAHAARRDATQFQRLARHTPDVTRADSAAAAAEATAAERAVQLATNTVARDTRLSKVFTATSGTLNAEQFAYVTRVALHRAHLPANWSISTLRKIVFAESSFQVQAHNGHYHGLYQMGVNPGRTAIDESMSGLSYIKGRYGSPEAAQAHEIAHHWY